MKLVLAWIEIHHDELGKPLLVLNGNALTESQKRGVTKYHVSLSHTDEYGTATIILER